MSIAETSKTSLEELLASPERGRFELVHGSLVEMPVGNLANRVTSRLAARLETYCDQSAEGEVFSSEQYYRCFGDDYHARKPDISVIRSERMPPDWQREGYFSIAPDLAVEVISINDVARDLEQKVEEYLEAGVRLIWVVHPETGTAMVYRSDGTVQRLHANDLLLGEAVLPGFSVRLGEVIGDSPRGLAVTPNGDAP